MAKRADTKKKLAARMDDVSKNLSSLRRERADTLRRIELLPELERYIAQLEAEQGTMRVRAKNQYGIGDPKREKKLDRIDRLRAQLRQLEQEQ